MRSFQEKFAEMPDPMTPEQLGTCWGVSADTVRGMCDREELDAFRAGRLWKIAKSTVLKHMQRVVSHT